MPSEDQLTQITENQTNNDISDPLPIIYKSATQETIRCPDGMVFSGSHVLSTNDEDLSVLKYTQGDGSSKWFKSDGSLDDSNSYTGSLVCVPKYCGPQGIVNSDKEFDVLVDNTVSETITCNDGYVFDTTNTKLGKVKCGTIPIMNDDGFNKENEVAWMVDNPAAEAICNSEDIGDETQCEGTAIPYIISSDTDKLYENHERQLNCTWIPEITSGGSGFTRNNGYCKFIHRADFNESEPICRSMYCSQKSVPYSNRIESEGGLLPGPETGAIHGKCVDFDGQIIDNITNSSDCACFKHKTSDTCNDGGDCQWCGYNLEDGSGGYCYSNKTHMEICNQGSIRNNYGGSCRHVKTGLDKPTEPTDGWSQETCEDTVCVKKNYWDGLNESSRETSKNREDNYKGYTTNGDCIDLNTEWNSGYVSSNNNDCILSNLDIFDTYNNNDIRINYYPIPVPVQDGQDGIQYHKFNIEDYICVPKINDTDDGGNTTPFGDNIKLCDDKTKADCGAPGDSICEWIQNPLRDSIFNWSQNHSIKFKNSDNCPITYLDGNSKEIPVPIRKEGQYIHTSDQIGTYADATTGITNTLTLNDVINDDYIDSCGIIDIKENSNIFSDFECNPNLLNSSTFTNNIKYCHQPNTAYCPYRDDNPLCSRAEDSERIKLSDDTVVSGCPYYDTRSDIPSTKSLAEYKCYGDNIKNYIGTSYFVCDPELTPPFNCHKYIGSGDSGTCTATGYTSQNIDTTVNTDQFYRYGREGETTKEFKKFILCNTINEDEDGDPQPDESKKRCNMIGNSNAYWGKLCQITGVDPDSDDPVALIPTRQVCDVANPVEGAMWGKYDDRNPATPVDLEYGCYKNDGTKYTDEQICSLLVVDVSNQNTLTDSNVLTRLQLDVANATTARDTATGDAAAAAAADLDVATAALNAAAADLDVATAALDAAEQLTLYTGDGVYDGTLDTCVIDFWGEDGNDFTDEQYTDICENSNNHSIGFKYYEYSGNREGQCTYIKNGAPFSGNPGVERCTNDNYTVVNEYNHNNTGTSESLGPSRNINIPDVPTTWTGGEISFQDGIHRSECSPSIMNSCNVNCDAGYGGGGEYICQYNDGGGDICSYIDRKTYPDPDPQYSDITKRGLCETYPACEYDEGGEQCTHNPGIKNDGHLEWMGSPCYKIDNTDFSHGIAKLPELDNVIPPFVRVFMYMVVYITLAVLIISLIVKFGLKLIGGGLDFSINNVFNSVNKLIDVITDSDKVVRKIILSEGVKKEHKAGYMIFTVGVFIGSYYLFQYIKDYIKDSWSDITNYIKKLKPSSVRMPTQVSQAFAEVRAEAGAAREAGADVPDIDLPDIDVTADVKFDNLKTIIQTLVGGTVIFIIIALVVKSDLIGKVEQK